LAAILNQKNGEMVYCLWFLKIKINANKNIKNLMYINGPFWMVMLIHFGFNLW